MHVHASDTKLTEKGSAKFFVKENGETDIQDRGRLNDREILEIQKFIKDKYHQMFKVWEQYSDEGYYRGH